MSAYDNDDDEYKLDEDEDDYKNYDREAQKEQVIFLIDVSPRMFEAFAMKEEDGNQCPVTPFEFAMEALHRFLKSRIISSYNDEIGVLFFNADKTKNPGGLEHVFTFFDLDVPDAQRIQDALYSVKSFQADVGSYDPCTEGGYAGTLRDGLWAANQAFQGKSSAVRRIFLFSNEEDPCKGPERTTTEMRARIASRVEQLADSGVTVRFFPLVPANQQFNMSYFWSEVLEMVLDEEDNYSYLSASSQTVLTGKEVQEALYNSLEAFIRKRMYKRRPAASLRWTITDELTIAVQVFNHIVQATAPPVAKLERTRNEVLTRDTKWLCQDTAEFLSEPNKLKAFSVKTGDKQRFPKVVLRDTELQAIKAVKPPGLKLLGFKPRACLQDYHQLSHSAFLRPNERELRGSTTAFKALLDAMVRRDKIAVCRYVRSKAGEPRMVALLPQLEVNNAFNMQVEPEGMYLIPLPYMDDIRTPETSEAIVGREFHVANDVQIAKAHALMEAITFPKDEQGIVTFSLEDVPNPSLQRYFDVIEAKALGQPLPDAKDMDDKDMTRPDERMEELHHDKLQAFQDAVFGAGYKATEGKKGTKRKAAEGPEASMAELYLGYDWKAMAASGELGKLTIPNLQIYLQYHRLPKSGAKAVLIDRIKNHLGGD